MMGTSVVVADLVVESGASVRCFRCNQFVGETDDRIELVGIGRGRDFVELIGGPKRTWKCKCGWTNIYKKK